MTTQAVGAETGTRVPDEELKRNMGLDRDRCDGAYSETFDTRSLQERLSQDYVEPTDENLRDAHDQIVSFLHDNRCMLVVPMRERGPVIEPMLRHVVGLMSPQNIIVVNDNSDDPAIQAVSRYGARLIHRDDWLNMLDWPRLLDILNLTERPTRGKGVAVLAGYLYLHFWVQQTGIQPGMLLQHDAEIAEYARYRGVEHLIWGLLQRPNASYVKMAKSGRGNERCMAARSSLPVLAASQNVAPKSRQRAQDLFDKLVKHKWMLTGEFGMGFELAMQRYFATGYLEETCMSIQLEDWAAQHGRVTAQVGNPNPRLDGANDDRKEAIMQQQISNFLGQMALDAPLFTEWTIETIRCLNHGVMSSPVKMGWVAPNDGPVVAEMLPNDRIIPSVTQLFGAGLVDCDAAMRLLEQT